MIARWEGVRIGTLRERACARGTLSAASGLLHTTRPGSGRLIAIPSGLSALTSPRLAGGFLLGKKRGHTVGGRMDPAKPEILFEQLYRRPIQQGLRRQLGLEH